MIKKALASRPDLQKYLFIRGFLISSNRIDKLDDFPFYGNWKEKEFGGFWFYWHNLTNTSFQSDGEHFSFLCGHCYHPFSMETDENKILQSFNHSFGTAKYHQLLDEITGVYVMGTICDGKMQFYVDAAGMQSAACCAVGSKLYISSHPQLIADLHGFEMDPFVKELISYKWYKRLLGPYLPADLTPFSEVKRIVPSIAYHFDGAVSHKRYWPRKEVKTATAPKDYQRVIESAADILRRNMELISKKFDNPWISLTGGIDSNTTFAAANGFYDRFHTFSYLSAPKEEPDVEAAKKIAAAFRVKHHLFEIPQSNEDIRDYETKVLIQAHNSGYVAPRKENESRKRFYLEQNCDCGVEVKSWVSETIRAYWYKYFARKKMPKLSPKLFRNLYKIFTTNRKLAHKIDRIFAEYIRAYEYDTIPSCYSPADMHYHEVSWGSWGGMNISEMKYCFDITFPYNNRAFLELLFAVPLEKRISDQHHLDMKKYLNRELSEMNIRVVNKEETKFRARMLNLIFSINRFLP
ncbi:MAG: hypothetical protein E7434_02770 [Ruminococcaceae bacterium]|nr:hypothetical protein [Oscillospiraceae bacterium]